MNRRITALYNTRAEAERVRDGLKAEHLGDDVKIRDRDASAAPPATWSNGWAVCSKATRTATSMPKA